ncbi:MAG: Helix-turn-helix domain [Pseudomonadota bacterium]
MESKEIGARLKSARLAAQMTQLDIAMRLKFARSTVSMIENGSRELRPGELEAFAAQYRVSPTSLLVNGDFA